MLLFVSMRKAVKYVFVIVEILRVAVRPVDGFEDPENQFPANS